MPKLLLIVLYLLLGVSVAVTAPIVVKLAPISNTETAATEKANARTILAEIEKASVTMAIVAAMSKGTGTITTTGVFPDVDVASGPFTIGSFITGGREKVHGTYTINAAGEITASNYQ